ncbi:MAG: zinc-ribbon domain-containing protein [Lachnospiraceae bacterium]|nr:zinc-ribbon domain-containing protein [Lachnospiraceae bacterium]
MFCPKCGSDNADNFKFCRVCGAPLAAKAEDGKAVSGEPEMKKPEEAAALPKAETKKPEAETPAEKPQYTAQPGFGGSAKAEGTVTVQERVAKVVRSPLSLIATLLLTAVIAFGIIYSILVLGDISFYLPESVSETFTDLSVASFIGGLIASIPVILICIGMWLLYASALRHKPGEIKTTGLTIIKVLVIIAFVLELIACAVGVIAMIGISTGSAEILNHMPEFRDVNVSGLVGVAGIIGLIFIAAAIVLGILFYIKLIGTLNWTGAMLRNEESRRGPSLYVAVIIFIEAFCALLGTVSAAGLTSVLAAIGLPPEVEEAAEAILPMLSGVAILALIETVFLVLCGVLILKLRKAKEA